MIQFTQPAKIARFRSIMSELSENARKQAYRRGDFLDAEYLTSLSEGVLLRSVARQNAIIWVQADAQAGVLAI